ncbi:hypothetical protein GCM10009727_88980 [Actinomadura napierensis]|uniref:Uncharacterized protein n=1 Tax=Actinomadura napierensis TaxID=267854 RepID=A0ABN3AGW8_9ACTN
MGAVAGLAEQHARGVPDPVEERVEVLGVLQRQHGAAHVVGVRLAPWVWHDIPPKMLLTTRVPRIPGSMHAAGRRCGPPRRVLTRTDAGRAAGRRGAARGAISPWRSGNSRNGTQT